MKAPRLVPEKNTWQILVIDPEGRWVHRRLDTLLLEASRLGIPKYIAAEAQISAEMILLKL